MQRQLINNQTTILDLKPDITAIVSWCLELWLDVGFMAGRVGPIHFPTRHCKGP